MNTFFECSAVHYIVGFKRFNHQFVFIDFYCWRYFDCECERCNDPADDILTAIRCGNQSCDEPLIIREDSEPQAITCKSCNTVVDIEHVKNAQKMMKNFPTKFSPEENVANVRSYYTHNFLHTLKNWEKYRSNAEQIFLTKLTNYLLFIFSWKNYWLKQYPYYILKTFTWPGYKLP